VGYALTERLRQLKLLEPSASFPTEPLPAHLPAWCDAGLLKGGLSVALDVRPDELLGPLTQRMGGNAAAVKVLEVRDKDGVELTVAWGGDFRTWTVADCWELVRLLNQAFASDTSVYRVAILGEWNDALQLWCLPSSTLRLLQKEAWFQTEG
jgi:hypothetical protein